MPISVLFLSILTSVTPPCDQVDFLAKMDTKKERNGMDLTEAEDIKKK